MFHIRRFRNFFGLRQIANRNLKETFSTFAELFSPFRSTVKSVFANCLPCVIKLSLITSFASLPRIAVVFLIVENVVVKRSAGNVKRIADHVHIIFSIKLLGGIQSLL